MLQDKKKTKQKKKHGRKRTAKKTNHVLYPRPHYVATNTLMSAWRTRFDVTRKKNKKRTNQDKHNRKRTARESSHVLYPSPSLRRNKLSHVYLAHPLRCCKKTNKPRQARQEAHRKKNNHVLHPPPSLRRDKLFHVCLAHPLSGMRCDHRHLRFR